MKKRLYSKRAGCSYISQDRALVVRYSRLGGATGVQPNGKGGKMMASFMG